MRMWTSAGTQKSHTVHNNGAIWLRGATHLEPVKAHLDRTHDRTNQVFMSFPANAGTAAKNTGRTASPSLAFLLAPRGSIHLPLMRRTFHHRRLAGSSDCRLLVPVIGSKYL